MSKIKEWFNFPPRSIFYYDIGFGRNRKIIKNIIW